MPATTKHQTIHPTTGQVATRTSENRIYTHAVWCRETSVYRKQQAIWNIELATTNLEWATARGEAEGMDTVGQHMSKTWGEMVQGHREAITLNQAALDADCFEPGGWFVDGWCSREDLARKKCGSLAGRTIKRSKTWQQGQPDYHGAPMYEVVIAPATVVKAKAVAGGGG